MSQGAIGEIALDLVVNSQKYKSQMAGIQNMAKKAGLALAAAFSVKGITDFTKQCLELGSDLQEVQNVVDVTFPSMKEKVNEFAQSAAQSFGLSETMAKSILEHSERCPRLSALVKEKHMRWAVRLPNFPVMWHRSII